MTADTLTLEHLVAAASKTARDVFNERGEVRPMWAGHTATGELVVVLPEGGGWKNTDEKESAIARARAIFKEYGVVRYAFITEAWMVDSAHTTPSGMQQAASLPRDASLESHPDRREAVIIMAEDKSRRALMRHYFILRPEHGKPTLSPPQNDRDGGKINKLAGRMFGLLE